MKLANRLADVSKEPGLYALYGGRARNPWVAYVGIAGNVRQRFVQHFERRDSSIVTGSSAVGLNVDAVAHADWWEDPSFDDRTHLRAAEVVAFDILDPALRSRGGVTKDAEALAARQSFRQRIERLLAGEPAGRFTPLQMDDLATRVTELERRIRDLERGQ